jgi:predicted aldo/keto reductase-like oxidoreductase
MREPIPKEELMQKRKLGRGGLEVSALEFGCMGMSYRYGPVSRHPEDVIDTLLPLGPAHQLVVAETAVAA